MNSNRTSNSNKRFIRKRSDNHSRGSSKNSSIHEYSANHYIRVPSPNKQIPIIDLENLDKVSHNHVVSKYLQRSKRANYQQLNHYEFNQNINSKLQECLKEEREKRKLLQEEISQLKIQIEKIKQQCQNLKLENTVLQQEKEYHIKEIEYLTKISFDSKTITLQSYRQQYLEKELQNIRNKQQQSKTQQQRKLEEQIQKINLQKYTLESHFKALKIANQCLTKQIENHDIIQSNEFTKLKAKHKETLIEFNNLKSQYLSLKSSLNLNNESSLLTYSFDKSFC